VVTEHWNKKTTRTLLPLKKKKQHHYCSTRRKVEEKDRERESEIPQPVTDDKKIGREGAMRRERSV
jgi:hypothetical protein